MGSRPEATLPATVSAKAVNRGRGPSVNVGEGPERTGIAVFHPVAGVPYQHALRVDVFAVAVWARDPSAAVLHHHHRRPRARYRRPWTPSSPDVLFISPCLQAFTLNVRMTALPAPAGTTARLRDRVTTLTPPQPPALTGTYPGRPARQSAGNRSLTLESVKHHLGPNWQRSVEPRHGQARRVHSLACYLTFLPAGFLLGLVSLDGLAHVVAGGRAAVLGSGRAAGPWFGGFRRAGQTGQRLADVAEPPPDPGGGEPAGRAGPLPGQPDVGGEVAGEMQLGVAGED